MKALLLPALLAASCSPAFAAEEHANSVRTCVSLAQRVGDLAAKHSERSDQMGMVDDKAVVLLLNKSTATWTIIVVLPNGCTKIAAAGTDWATIPTGDPA